MPTSHDTNATSDDPASGDGSSRDVESPQNSDSSDGSSQEGGSSGDKSSSESNSSSESEESSQKEDSASDEEEKNWLEWTVFAIGLVITLGVIGYMSYQAIAGSDKPADIQVTLQEPTLDGDFIIIPIEATNKGDRVAEGAMIEVCSGPDSCGEVTFTYIPQGSKRTGVVGLQAPLEEPLTTRVVSFRKP